jgi:hypothetical protein
VRYSDRSRIPHQAPNARSVPIPQVKSHPVLIKSAYQPLSLFSLPFRSELCNPSVFSAREAAIIFVLYGKGGASVCLQTSTTACRQGFGQAHRQPNFVRAERSYYNTASKKL